VPIPESIVSDLVELLSSEVDDAEERPIAERHSLRTRHGTDRRTKLVLLTRDLAIGGAQRQLVTLALGLDRSIFEVSVLCLYGGGELLRELIDAGVSVISLDKSGRWDLARFSRRFVTVLRKLQPDILHSYLTAQNLLTVFVRPALPADTRVVWGVRASNMDMRQYDWLAKSACWLESRVSRFADLIIFNSNAGRTFHLAAGFGGCRVAVIPNAVDTRRFATDKGSGSRLRATWCVPEGSLLIGIVGRLDPMKDHQTFLKAAAILANSRVDARFVCIGTGPEPYASDLKNLAGELGVGDKVIWPGLILHDVPAAYNALDICCSSSAYGEGTSNAIAEAMACGVPCVVTDVGDSKLIVGETGVLVPPKNPEALAAGWVAMAERLSKDPRLPHAVRERIESRLSLAALVRKTSERLLDLL
jgi:glycosyltransferase involved in cell wall biosynthesis